MQRLAVVAIPFFICEDCEETGKGDPVRREWQDASISDVDVLVKGIPGTISNSHIPVGWSGYGLNVVRCPACVAQRRVKP